MKVGKNLTNDLNRASLIRQKIGWDKNIMMDANGVWDVDEALHNMQYLSKYKPFWIEEQAVQDPCSFFALPAPLTQRELPLVPFSFPSFYLSRARTGRC